MLNNIQLAQIANYNSKQLFNPSPAFENSVDPDELASEEANWSGSSLLAIKYINFISTIRIKWSDWLKIRSGCGILIYSAWQGLNIFFLTNTTLWTKSVDNKLMIFFLIFLRIQSLICMTCHSLLPGKNEENIIISPSAEFFIQYAKH